jgi:hypothetical protein
MRVADLIRRLRRRGITLAQIAAISIAMGLGAAVVVDAVTGSAHYGLWVGSAVTIATTSILIRFRRDA